MVMQPGPVCEAYEDLCARLGKKPRVIYMTPQGRVFNQTIAQELAGEEDLVFLCGHYEGIDERVQAEKGNKRKQPVKIGDSAECEAQQAGCHICQKAAQPKILGERQHERDGREYIPR